MDKHTHELHTQNVRKLTSKLTNRDIGIDKKSKVNIQD